VLLQVYQQRMATPFYTLRLSTELKKKVAEIGKAYGAPNTSAFIRELLQAVCSGDVEQAAAFQRRLSEKLTGQLFMDFNAMTPAQRRKMMDQISRGSDVPAKAKTVPQKMIEMMARGGDPPRKKKGGKRGRTPR
jgi:hypothetical protein